MNRKPKFRIGIIGSGTVGSTTGKAFHKLGHQVIFHDISDDIILSLKKQGYHVASNIDEIISKTDVSFVCVNTPTNKNGQQDLSQIMSVLLSLTQSLNNNYINNSNGANASNDNGSGGDSNSSASSNTINRGTDTSRSSSSPRQSTARPHLIVFRSTLLPGTMKNVVISYLERNCSLERGKDYNVCYNPEFLRKHASLDDFFNPDRVVIGEDEKGASYNSSLPLKQLYKQITNDIIVTDYDTAEMIKYASNCFLSLKISFFNEIGLICRRLGIDQREVNMAVALDKRIGKYGTEAGRPFRGPCLPKDTQALAYFAKRLRIKPDLIQPILEINEKLEEEYEEQFDNNSSSQPIEETLTTSSFTRGTI